MTDPKMMIKCPDCGHEFDISDVLYDQVELELKQQFKAQLEREKKALADRVTARIREEQADQLKDLREELQAKSLQVRELNKAKADIERLKRENAEAESKIEAEMEQKLGRQLAEERQKIRQMEEEKLEKKVAERDQLIHQLKDQVEIMKKKAEQGSMQLQGEVQELIIEDWLATAYPLDTVEEIKKGARGGDCIQTINTRTFTNCGRIYYESKRTKMFQPLWIEKFKTDIREKNASIGVLVTEAMPADMDRMGYRDGVWICSYSEFKGLSNVLRESLISLNRVVAQQENRGDKTAMVYDYVTSDEYRLQVEAIVEGFTQMKIDLDTEKRAMASIWKKREKQIEKVLLNTSHMYSSIKGIAGNAIPQVRSLELPGEVEEAGDED